MWFLYFYLTPEIRERHLASAYPNSNEIIKEQNKNNKNQQTCINSIYKYSILILSYN